MWEFPNIGVTYFGVLIIRILLFRVLYSGPLFSETPWYRTALGECSPQQALLQKGGVHPV